METLLLMTMLHVRSVGNVYYFYNYFNVYYMHHAIEGYLMIRLMTSIVQLALAIPALIMGRMMWEMIKEDFREWDKSH